MPTYSVNRAAVAKARQMIDSRQYDIDTPWAEGAPSSEDGNAKIERDGYESYGEWHLGLDQDASEDTKDRFGFPFGDFRRVHRSALIHAKQRAAQNGHDQVEGVADELLGHLDQVRGA